MVQAQAAGCSRPERRTIEVDPVATGDILVRLQRTLPAAVNGGFAALKRCKAVRGVANFA